MLHNSLESYIKSLMKITNDNIVIIIKNVNKNTLVQDPILAGK